MTTTLEDHIRTPREMAEQLHISVRQAQDMLSDGVVVGFKIGKLWRVRQSEIEKFVARSEAAHRGRS